MVPDKGLITYSSTGGFAKRLNAILDAIGLPNPGRYAYIGTVTGMSPSNSRSIFVNDRPPKNHLFVNKLTNALATSLSEIKSIPVKNSDVLEHLLVGHGTVTTMMYEGEVVIDRATAIIPLSFHSKISHKVNEIGHLNKIDIFTDISNVQLTLLLKKIALYTHENELNMEDKTFKELVVAAMTLAKYSIL